MELQVLVHGVDVVEDVLDDAGDDAHHVRVVEDALRDKVLLGQDQGSTIWGNYRIAIMSTNIAIAIWHVIFLFNVPYVQYYSLNKQ